MNILFLFTLGSEVRQFYHSGVIEALKKRGHRIVISTRTNVEVIKSVIKDSDIEVIKNSNIQTPTYLKLIQNVIDDSSGHRWVYKSKKVIGAKARAILFLQEMVTFFSRLFFLKWLLILIEKFLIRRISSKVWKGVLESYEVDQIILNVPNSNHMCVFTANTLDVPVKLIYHTNKDIIAMPRIAHKYQKIGVWNGQMRAHILKNNPIVNPKNILILGSAHFQYLLTKKSQETYHDSGRYLLYVAAASHVVSNEAKYIDDILRVLNELGDTSLRIVVRTNPMDKTNYWEEYAMSKEKVIINQSKWYYDDIVNFNFPFSEDLVNFKKLLEGANCCVGLPSTVAIESAIVGVPNINICYEHPDVVTLYGNVGALWDADFYENVRTLGGAIGVKSYAELKKHVTSFCTNRALNEKLTSQVFLKKEIEVDLKEIINLHIRFIEND